MAKQSTLYKAALSRDDYKCVRCGSKKNVAVFFKNPDKPATLENLHTLDIPCMCIEKNIQLKVHNPSPRVILELRDNGFSDIKIANMLGQTRQRLYQIMQEYTKAVRILKI